VPVGSACPKKLSALADRVVTLSSEQIGLVVWKCNEIGNGFFCVNEYISWNLNTDCPAKIIGDIYENPDIFKESHERLPK
jgi:hypothetical protein